MNSKIKGPIKIEAMRAQAVESMGMEPGMDVEMPDGQIFHLPSPMLVEEDRQVALNALGDKQDSISTAKAILGEDEHLKFLAAGGRSNDVSLAWAAMTAEARNNPKLPR